MSINKIYKTVKNQRTGQTIVDSKLAKLNVYLKIGIVCAFKGIVDYHLNGEKEQHSFKGNWRSNRVG